MNLFVIMMLFQGVFSKSLPAKKVSTLEINCVGECVVHTVKGDKIELEVSAPDSMRNKFDIENRDDVIVCGVVSSIKNNSGVESISRFFRDIKDSIKIDIKIPEKLVVDTLSMNLGVARAKATLKKYHIYSLQVSVGAGNVTMNFDGKNRVKNGKITINAGVGKIKLNSPENFLADTLYINSGIAGTVLKFRHRPRIKPFNIYLSSAMSSFTMVLPEDVTCEKGEVESFFTLSSLENCDSSEGDIILNIRGALSSIDVIREDRK